MALRKRGDVIAKKATTIAVVNQKGGTAKTTTCENLGIGLAMQKNMALTISKSIQGHQRQLTTEERTFLKASIDNRYQERAVANGSLMMCEVQGAKEDFIRRWNTIFKEYPDVFEDSDCRKIIYDLTEDAVQYLLKIKEKTL